MDLKIALDVNMKEENYSEKVKRMVFKIKQGKTNLENKEKE